MDTSVRGVSTRRLGASEIQFDAVGSVLVKPSCYLVYSGRKTRVYGATGRSRTGVVTRKKSGGALN